MHSTKGAPCPIQPHFFPSDYDVSASPAIPSSLPLPMSIQRPPLQPIFSNNENTHTSFDDSLRSGPELSFTSSTRAASKCVPRLITDSPDFSSSEVPSSSPTMVKLTYCEPPASVNNSLKNVPHINELSPTQPLASSLLLSDTNMLTRSEGGFLPEVPPPVPSVSNLPPLSEKSQESLQPVATPNSPSKSAIMLPTPAIKPHSRAHTFRPLTNELYEKNRADIDFLTRNDLRFAAIKTAFESRLQGLHLRVISSIQQEYDCATLPFTFGEKTGLKELVSNNVPLEEIRPHFPVRSHEFMLQKYNEFVYTIKRRKTFKNATDRLLYEAQWTASDASGSSVRLRRKIQNEHVSIESEPKRQKMKASRQAIEERTLVSSRSKAPIALKTKSAQKGPQKDKKTLLKINRSGNLPNIAPKHTPKRLSKDSKPLIRLGEKIKRVTQQRQQKNVSSYNSDSDEKSDNSRRRYVKKSSLEDRLVAFVPLRARSGNRKQINLEPKGLLRRVRPSTVLLVPLTKVGKRALGASKARMETLSSVCQLSPEKTPDPDQESESGPELLEEEPAFSAFSPPNVLNDVLVPLHDRQLFISDLYERSPTFHSVHEIASSDRFSKSLQPAFDDIDHDPTEGLMIKDDLAHGIIKMHTKKYRSLPILFPPLFDPDDHTQINGLNIINVRFLLYPQHYELFLLAEPKSNELDPIQEITKLMMIHYALFFSHSESIRTIIMHDYCSAIQDAVELNDFALFLFTIDKWNLLMLKLSPNAKAVQEIEHADDDINSTVRIYLGENEKREISPEDVNLSHFHQEIILEEASPKFDPILLNVSDLCLSGSNTDKNSWAQPREYASSFTSRLREKKDISRFAVQQILQRVYARVVSTDSKKLRSYKAFTAEVYGELLPSFTSEVLEKVNLRPLQKFYDLGSGVGNTVLQAALEFGCELSGGCELMGHASRLAYLQQKLLDKHMALFGLKALSFNNALLQSFVDNQFVREAVLDCDVLIINNYLFDVNLNSEVGRLLNGLKTGTKIISLRNFIRPRYKALGDTIFDRLKVEKHEMTEYMLVSWTANKVPYYISTVSSGILPEYLGKLESPDLSEGSSLDGHAN